MRWWNIFSKATWWQEHTPVIELHHPISTKYVSVVSELRKSFLPFASDLCSKSESRKKALTLILLIYLFCRKFMILHIFYSVFIPHWCYLYSLRSQEIVDTLSSLAWILKCSFMNLLMPLHVLLINIRHYYRLFPTQTNVHIFALWNQVILSYCNFVVIGILVQSWLCCPT